jgi:hypothetical protein
VGKTLFFDSQIDFGHVDRSATPAPMFNSIIRSLFLTTSHSFARHSGKLARLTLAGQQPTCLSSGFQTSVKEVGVGNHQRRMTAAINHEVKTVVQKRIHKEVLTDVTQRTLSTPDRVGMLNAVEIDGVSR